MNNLNETQNLNYEQKKNNGKGVFYGVIAVATLIVAIIGATFAYFTASANSSNEALRATAAHVEVNYLEGRQLVATNLIPSSADVVAKAYARPTAYEKNMKANCTHKTDDNSKEANPESMTVATNWTCPDGVTAASTGDVGTKCVDDNGYYVCAVYQFTVTNTSNVKQALQAYMTINSNDFTTVDAAAAAAGNTLTTDHSNGALKFMTVRSGSIIDVNAVSSEAYNAETNPVCQNDLYSTNVTQSTKSTKFCTPVYASCTQELIDNTEHECHGKTTNDKYISSWNADVNSEGNALANNAGIFTDTSGSYYFYNTTAVRQSLLATGTQNVFSGEILPSIDAANLTSSNGILYMHTVSQGTNNVTTVGPADNSKTLEELYPGTGEEGSAGKVYADTNGYVYANEAACLSGKTYNATCHQVYLSTSSSANGENDVVVGAYGQVSRTYYIVAWLEENNPNNNIKFYDGLGALSDAAKARGKKVTDNLDQDDDQDKSFATTINVTSGSLGSAGITGTIN